MKLFAVPLASLVIAGLAFAATVQAQPTAVVSQLGEPSYANGGAWVWLDGRASTGTDLKYRWTSDKGNVYWYTDDGGVTYKKYAESAAVGGRYVLAYLLPGVTRCTLTVTERADSSLTSTDYVDVVIDGEDPSAWLVVTYRPWAQDMDERAADIVTKLAPLPNTNADFKTAKNAAKVAQDYETFCQTMRYDFAADNYDAVVTQYYLAARQVQIQHHEGVAFHTFFGLRSRKWSPTVTNAANAAIDAALDAAEAGQFDLDQGTARVMPD